MSDPQFRPSAIVPLLQTLVLMACIASVTVLGVRNVIDAAAVTAIIGTIAGSVGVLAGVNIGARTKTETPRKETP